VTKLDFLGLVIESFKVCQCDFWILVIGHLLTAFASLSALRFVSVTFGYLSLVIGSFKACQCDFWGLACGAFRTCMEHGAWRELLGEELFVLVIGAFK
jgi:hypothetical protein